MPRFDLPPGELRTYRAETAEPADFDAFWQATLDESRSLVAPVERTTVETPLRAVHVEDVAFSGFGGDRVRAWLVRPAGAAGPLPAIVEYVGYGRGRGLPHERLHWPVAGYAQLVVDTRGQGSVWGTGGSTPDPHGAGPAVPGFLTRGIESPESYYYRRVFTDAALAVDAARALPEIDPDRITVCGNSQGGAMAIAAAGLVEGLAGVLTSAPILCDVRRAIGFTGEEPHAEIARYLAVHRDAAERVFATLAYVDGVSFARRATAPALFSAGHLDTISPPSTVYAAFNDWGAPAEMADYPWNGHEGGEGVHWQRQADWLTARLAARLAA